MMMSDHRAGRRGDLLEAGLLGFIERLRLGRERAFLRSVVREMLTYDDRLLDDVGLSRAVLERALSHPQEFRDFDDIRRRSAEELETTTLRFTSPKR